MNRNKPDIISEDNNILNIYKAYNGNKKKSILLIVSIISIIITIAFCSFVFGIYFALGYILLTVSHEAGHYLVAKKLKFSVDSFAFFPFMAYIKFKETPKDCREDAIISLGGPISESVIALIYLTIYIITGENVLLVLAFIGFFLALLNLIPANLLDGGRIVGAINPKMWFIGLPILIAIFIKTREPLFLIMILLVAFEFYHKIKKRDELIDYFKINKCNRIALTGIYFSLTFLLFIAIIYMHYIIDIKIIIKELLKI